MINQLEDYAWAGRKAAQARNEQDEARATFHARWFRDARALERAEDRATITEAYTTAYKAARRV